MVTSVTNLSRSGLYDWMAQRVSAVVLAAYFIFLIGYLVANPGIGYAQWHELFASNWMRIFSLLALVALGAHAWVGMWTIATDYLTPNGCWSTPLPWPGIKLQSSAHASTAAANDDGVERKCINCVSHESDTPKNLPPGCQLTAQKVQSQQHGQLTDQPTQAFYIEAFHDFSIPDRPSV